MSEVRMAEILVCGEALVDLTAARCEGERGFVPRPGGSPFNVAIGLARLGTAAGFCGRVSTDPFGRLLRRTLEADGVGTEWLSIADEPSPLAFVHLDAAGQAEYAFHFAGSAGASLRSSDVPQPLPDGVTAVHVGSIALVLEPGAAVVADLLAKAHRQGRVTSLDPNVRGRFIGDRAAYASSLEQWVAQSSVVKASTEDLAWVWPDEDPAALARRWAAGGRLVVLTDGARGALAVRGDERHEIAARATSVIDTVGAGDAFTSGLLAALDAQGCLTPEGLEQADVRAAVSFAASVAAMTCTRAGADPPHRDELR
ncbi:carbohydrate kinase [Egibacter rhizosphaerae]|uniref:Carbohydrate kinase n=1 Tax=Egibacter rhizosphaerae TaxID=1670831 RepID=A0A411YKJ4_9ACTN|nr:carbohydrate kinase [Egibacter rhizosphaerae]